MRVSAARALRVLVASTRASAARVARSPPARPCSLHGSAHPSVRGSGWHQPSFARTAGTRLKSTSENEEHVAALDAAAAHERALAAARAVQETMAGTPGKAFEETEVDRAKAQILRFLNYKPRTRAELMTKLVEDKLYDPTHAAAAIAYLQEKGVHSDVDYAEQWARYKWRTAKWAPRRIETSLREKGVARDDARAGLKRVFASLGDVSSPRNGSELRSDSETHVIAGEEEDKANELLRAARKRWALSFGMVPTTRRRRLAAWLDRRGHSLSTTRDVIETLEREDREREWAEEAKRDDTERGYEKSTE